MSEIIKLRLRPEDALNNQVILDALSKKIQTKSIGNWAIVHRSLDARQKSPIYELQIAIYGNLNPPKPFRLEAKEISNRKEVAVIGTGPAGLFCGLHLVRLGFRPIFLERGKPVERRPADLRSINIHQTVNPDSNYCFGEGGAGTYSDGKLYTRSHKRGSVSEVLQIFIQFGADPSISIDAHPHIGTNKLPRIIKNIREFLISVGAEFHFESRVTDFKIEGNQIKGLVLNKDIHLECQDVVVATGHSARDIFDIYQKHGLSYLQKPIAVGVRVEHPQELIDELQYKTFTRNSHLPPAEYSMVTQVENLGVYSFCMCPGGVIAPCATAPGEIVTNGWSSSQRSRPTANSGIVVTCKPDMVFGSETGTKDRPISMLDFQKRIENKAFLVSEKSQKAPAQRLTDFLEGRVSSFLPKTSYPPGVVSSNLIELFPNWISEALRSAFRNFDQKKKGYVTENAILHAPETRTSSPIQIRRDPISLEHPQCEGLYPCGEGAGYAGGIISAAIDGTKVASSIAAKYSQSLSKK